MKEPDPEVPGAVRSPAQPTAHGFAVLWQFLSHRRWGGLDSATELGGNDFLSFL